MFLVKNGANARIAETGGVAEHEVLRPRRADEKAANKSFARWRHLILLNRLLTRKKTDHEESVKDKRSPPDISWSNVTQMKHRFSELQIARLLVCFVVLVNAAALLSELSISRFDLNDSVFHYTMADRMVQAFERGENPIDCWVSEWTLGYPVSRTYQPLGHLLLAALYVLLGKTVTLMTLFVWVRYLAVALFPLTVYFAGRQFSLSPTAAAGAALISPLISTNGLFGLEYGSYVWRGSGLFTQAIAVHFLLLAMGFTFKAMRGSGKAILPGVMLGLTFLAHFIYGFVGAISVCMIAVIPNALPASRRIGRTVTIGVVAFSISAFELVPALLDSPLANHSRWEPAWKWNSFGAGAVFKQLVTGALMDFGRLPFLSLLVLLGALVCVLLWYKLSTDKSADGSLAAHRSIFCGAVLWLLLFFGRPAWGVLLTILGTQDIQLHRLIGGVHVFFIFLGGIGLATIWNWIRSRSLPLRNVIVVAVTAALLLPAVRERRDFLLKNKEWGESNLEALRAERTSIDQLTQKLRSVPGRIYPGLAANWGKDFRVGSVPLYGILSTHHLPAVAFLYHAMALTSDIMVLFDEMNPAHYRLFNVSTVLSDGRPPPSFVHETDQVGRFHIASAPGHSYFDVVRAPFAIIANKNNFYETNSVWLQSDWVGKGVHLLLEMNSRAPAAMPRLSLGQALPDVEASAAGTVLSEHKNNERYSAVVNVDQPGYVLFKMTYHSNWRAIVDGVSRNTVMLTPGFIGVAVDPGRHQIEMRYSPGPLKNVLLVSGFLFLAIILVQRNTLHRVEGSTATRMEWAWQHLRMRDSHRWMQAAGVLLLALPVFLPLITTELTSGHDAFTYHPRLVEFHDNIAHGILLPRWSAHLGNGAGQPLFIFSAPLLYYAAELFHLLGFSFVTSLNLTAVAIVCSSAWFMFLLADYFFGRRAAWLASVAYVYAPYFHVDLYVRHAFAESAAFAFYPLALYGFGRYGRERNVRYLMLGAVAWACIILSHYPSALLFIPILLAFLIFLSWQKRSIRMLRDMMGGFVAGLGLSAFAWLPALAESPFVNIQRTMQGYLNYASHLVFPQQLLSWTWGYGLSIPGSADTISFSLGWSHVLLAAVGAFFIRKSNSTERWCWIRFFAWSLLVLAFLMMPPSLWFWDNLPLLRQVQFPWRILAGSTLCLAILIGLYGASLEGRRYRLTFFWAGIALLILPNLSHIAPEKYLQIDPADWTPYRIARSGFETTTSHEFEPKWVKNRLPFTAEPMRVISGDAALTALRHSPSFWTVESNSSTSSIVEAALLYFPGWSVSVDGVEVPIDIAVNSGRIRFRIPGGTHHAAIQFKHTPIRMLSEIVSILTLAGVVVLALFKRRRVTMKNAGS